MDIRVGDTLKLRDFNDDTLTYTFREREISYIGAGIVCLVDGTWMSYHDVKIGVGEGDIKIYNTACSREGGGEQCASSIHWDPVTLW